MTYPLLLTHDELANILAALEFVRKCCGDGGTKAGELYDRIWSELEQRKIS
jgi:hypothetical protein